MMTQAEVLTDTLQGVAGAVTTGNFQESDVWLSLEIDRLCKNRFNA